MANAGTQVQLQFKNKNFCVPAVSIRLTGVVVAMTYRERMEFVSVTDPRSLVGSLVTLTFKDLDMPLVSKTFKARLSHAVRLSATQYHVTFLFDFLTYNEKKEIRNLVAARACVSVD
jgi:hypothetical protein